MRTIFLFVLFSFICSPAFPQPATGIPYIQKIDIPGCEINRTAHFDGNSLWGYINGGADIFLEYGFQSLLVQEITWKNFYFKVEVYKMRDVEGAFGIFSINRFNCEPDTVGHPYTCQMPYHLQMAYGNFYISIINQAGSEKAAQLSVSLARALMKQAEPDMISLPGFLEDDLFKPHLRNMYLFRGAMGMQNRQGPWNNYFQNKKNFEIIVLPLSEEDKKKFLAMARSFKGERQHFDKFIEYLDDQDLYLRTWQYSNRIIMLFGGSHEDLETQKMYSVIETYIQN